MSNQEPIDRAADFEEALRNAAGSTQRYVLRLYVTGSTPRSSKAIQSIRSLCEIHLNGRYDLEVIDIYQQPVLAKGEQIIAAPTLIRKLPAPLRKVVGDLSNTERVLIGLDLRPADLDNHSAPASPAMDVEDGAEPQA
jgi:circadian clock protein KaiB